MSTWTDGIGRHGEDRVKERRWGGEEDVDQCYIYGLFKAKVSLIRGEQVKISRYPVTN